MMMIMGNDNSKACSCDNSLLGTAAREFSAQLDKLQKPYHALVVQWTDGMRAFIDDETPTCFGSNITDSRIKTSDGANLIAIRTENMNEALGTTSPDSIMLRSGLSLTEVLKNASSHAKYAGLGDSVNLYDPDVDHECYVRFQATFLPLRIPEKGIDFAPEAHNLNTTNDEDPRNMLIMATQETTSFVSDKNKPQALFSHSYDPTSGGLPIGLHYLHADPTEEAMGHEEKADQGSPLLCDEQHSFGLPGMRNTMNALMVIQIPLKMEHPAYQPVYRSLSLGGQRGATPPSYGRCSIARLSQGKLHARINKTITPDKPVRAKEPVVITYHFYYCVEDPSGIPHPKDFKQAIDDLDAAYALCTTTQTLAQTLKMGEKYQPEQHPNQLQGCVYQPSIHPKEIQDAHKFAKHFLGLHEGATQEWTDQVVSDIFSNPRNFKDCRDVDHFLKASSVTGHPPMLESFPNESFEPIRRLAVALLNKKDDNPPPPMVVSFDCGDIAFDQQQPTKKQKTP